MEAYGIFDGGGVKGAALAGCLAAAENRGIEFIGFGGTSAGSIVALLAAVGYSGEELKEILVSQDFKELLDDDGESVLRLKKELGRILEGTWCGKLRVLCSLLGVRWKLRDEIRHLLTHHGLNPGERLMRFLLEKVRAKRQSFEKHTDISFADLEREGAWPLKIVASDVSSRRPAVFSREHTEYGTSVIDAVRASTCYPFVFRPVIKNDRRLLDGGLSSNLPSFLFAEEYRRTRVPTFAFDLITPERELPTNYGLLRLLGDMTGTALEASDELIRGAVEGVVHIPIHLSQDIDAMDFEITESDRRTLYLTGYEQTSAFLGKYEPLKTATQAGSDVKRQLMARYGNPKIYQPLLAALAREIEEISNAENIRAHMMLPTGRKSLIVVYHFGMDDDPDSDLELAEDAGCNGRAFSERQPMVADLEEAARDPDPWKMSREQHNKVPRERQAMLTVPIPVKMAEEGPGGANDRPAGTLSIDSTTALIHTGWVTGERIDTVLVTKMTLWAAIISRVLP